MRCFLVVALILSAVLGTVFCGKAEFMEIKKKCLEKNNVNSDDMKNTIDGLVPEADITQDAKCFYSCMSESMNFTKDGVFQPQVFIEALSKENDKDLVTKAAAECDVKGKDECDTGFKLALCIKKHKLHKRE